MTSSRKCEKCGAVTWADSKECSGCESGVTKSRLISRIRIYLLLALGCAAVFGVYWYVHRPQPPTDLELRFAFQKIVNANTTRTGTIVHSPGQDGTVQTQLLGDINDNKLESYRLDDAEIYQTNEGTHYSAKFSLSCWNLNSSRGSRVIKGLIRLKLVDEKWITEYVALAD